ncbi:MAG: mechanosensitive ion channel domain-containing protein [Burkholderiaceae bacterium]
MENSAEVLKFIRPGGIPTALLVFAIAWFGVQLLRKVGEQLGDRMVDRRLAINQALTILRFVIYIGTFAVTVSLVFTLTREMMIALGGTIAVTVGFALKDLTASVIAGVTLLVDKPFQVGDRVTFNGFYGEIVSIGLRSVRLVTLDDNLVTIPNNKFLNDIVSSGNAGELNMLIQQDFYIGIDQDLAAAKRIAGEAITSCPYAFLDKPWAVLVNEVIHEQYFALRLRTKVYVMDVRHEKLLESDITERIVQGFAAAGIGRPCIHYRNAPMAPARELVRAAGPALP